MNLWIELNDIESPNNPIPTWFPLGWMSSFAFVHYFDNKKVHVVCGLLWENMIWKYLVNCHYYTTTLLFTFVYVYVCLCLNSMCVVLQGAEAVSLRGQPALLWNVHPDGHYHEQHRSGSWGPRASQRTTQQRESDWHLEFVDKHLEVHNKHWLSDLYEK